MNLQKIRLTLAEFILPQIFEQNRILRSERRNAERRALRDELTGLANRRAFNNAQTEAEMSTRFSFVVFDLNRFKSVNDILGHSAGDAVLKQLAFVLKSEAVRIGFGERVFRYAGDEMVAIVPTVVAEAFRDRVESVFGNRLIGGGVIVSVSGTIGKTFAIADGLLQTRKNQRKLAQIVEVSV